MNIKENKLSNESFEFYSFKTFVGFIEIIIAVLAFHIQIGQQCFFTERRYSEHNKNCICVSK